MIHGPCQDCAKTKGTKRRRTGHYPYPPTYLGERLVGDLFFIASMTFLLISCRLVKLFTVRCLRNKSAQQMMLGIGECVDVWKGYGSTPKFLGFGVDQA